MSALADREWRLVREDRRPGPMQMALDEVAAETAVEGGPRTVRIYSWEPSALSLGYRQDPDTVDWSFCKQERIDVTRRQTGGGGIYHDTHGDISYSIVAPAAELPGDLMDCYELLCGPILDAFDRMGVDAAFADAEQPSIYQPSCYLRSINPAHDVIASGSSRADKPRTDAPDRTETDAPDGQNPDTVPGRSVDRKISGNAQYRQRDAVIQHGSLSFDILPDRHLGVFADPGVEEETFSDRVTSIRGESGIDRKQAISALETALGQWTNAESGGWTDAELDRARELVDSKYGADAWIRHREHPPR
jgi:lipoate-protein ligase A